MIDGTTASSIVTVSSWAMIITGFLTVVALLFYTPAPYGRYSSRSWGVLVPANLAWFFMESPNLWITALVYVLHTANPADMMFRVIPSRWSTVGNDSLPNKVLLGCFLLHYFNRSIVYPLRMGMAGSSKPMPLTVMMLAWFFCLWNGSNQALHLIISSSSSYSVDYLHDWKFILGLSIFFTGMCINIHSDSILLALKNRPGSSSSSSGENSKSHYRIPRGGLFEYVSCANFFGEILEWIGFALACNSLPAYAFAFYTACNVGPRAIQHHNWYLDKFKDEYPSLNRKALIPFIL